MCSASCCGVEGEVRLGLEPDTRARPVGGSNSGSVNGRRSSLASGSSVAWRCSAKFVPLGRRHTYFKLTSSLLTGPKPRALGARTPSSEIFELRESLEAGEHDVAPQAALAQGPADAGERLVP